MNIYFAAQTRPLERPEYAEWVKPNTSLDYALFALTPNKLLRTALLHARGKALTAPQVAKIEHTILKRPAPTSPDLGRNQIYGLTPEEEQALNRAVLKLPILAPPLLLDLGSLQSAGRVVRGVYKLQNTLIYINEDQEVGEGHLKSLAKLKSDSIYVWYRYKYFLERTDAIVKAIVDHLPGILSPAEAEKPSVSERSEEVLPPRKEWAQIGPRESLTNYRAHNPLREYTEKEKSQVQGFCRHSLQQMAKTLEASATEGGQKLKTPVIRQQHKLVESAVQQILEFWDLFPAFLGQITEGNYLASHALKASVLAMQVATSMGMSKKEVVNIGFAAVLQDVGMTNLKSLPYKLTPLAPGELDEIRRHPSYSAAILKQSDGIPAGVVEIVEQAHERWDGSGYPQGLAGSQTLAQARILTTINSYVAMISPRPYRIALEPYDAVIALISSTYHKQLDRDVTKALLDVLSVCPIGMYVKLSTGEIASVKSANKDTYTRPVVSVLYDADQQRLATPRLLDLAYSESEIVEILSSDEIPESASLRTVF